MTDNAPKNNRNDIWWRPAILLFFQMSAWIGIPVIIGLFLGRWADERYNTEPWLFLTFTGVAFIVSIIGMVRESKRAMKSFDSIDKKSDVNRKDNHKNDTNEYT